MSQISTWGPSIACGELYCFDCEKIYKEKDADRNGNKFFCPGCGRFIGEVVSDFASMSLTPLRILRGKLPPGFYISFHDNNIGHIKDFLAKMQLRLVYVGKKAETAALRDFPITINPEVLIKDAEEYLKNPDGYFQKYPKPREIEKICCFCGEPAKNKAIYRVGHERYEINIYRRTYIICEKKPCINRTREYEMGRGEPEIVLIEQNK